MFVFGKTEERLFFLNLEGKDLKVPVWKGNGRMMTSSNLYTEVRHCLLYLERRSRDGFGVKGCDL